MVTKSASTSETSVTEPENASPGEKRNPEKGSDYELIDWLENDPEVQCSCMNSSEPYLTRNRILEIGPSPRKSLSLSRFAS